MADLLAEVLGLFAYGLSVLVAARMIWTYVCDKNGGPPTDEDEWIAAVAMVIFGGVCWPLVLIGRGIGWFINGGIRSKQRVRVLEASRRMNRLAEIDTHLAAWGTYGDEFDLSDMIAELRREKQELSRKGTDV